MTTRRDFLRQLAIASMATTGIGAYSDLRRIAAAAAPMSKAAGDYKALVCLFFFGGNDSNNTVIPTSATEYAQYAGPRANLALGAANVLPITIANTPGRTFGLHPAMAGMRDLVNIGKAAVVANVGPLLAPTTRDQYRNRSVPLPSNLFSHSDQQAQWQSSVSDAPSSTGWGGRIADIMKELNGTATTSTCISVAGNNLWENGNTISSFKVSPNSGFGMKYYKGAAATDPVSRGMNEMLAAGAAQPHLFDRTWMDIVGRSITSQQALQDALNTSTLATVFPNTGLAGSLRMIARLIGARAALGVTRQVYFASIGGFDTHGSEQLGRQAELLGEVSGAVKAFYDATVELGVANNVTLFTASDFNRTFASNGKGSDHAWGSHQFVVGGAVQGGNMFGAFPTLVVGGPDDTDTGRWIPTTSIDQYAATLATWFGVSPGDMPTIFPRLSRFATPNLGFMAPA
jgi:uncharacterized protein (DUF1501 family)